jgi:hypothetical protein
MIGAALARKLFIQVGAAIFLAVHPMTALAGQLPCDQAAGLRSKSGSIATRITLVNLLSEPVLVKWINYAGASVDFGRLEARERKVESTYATHAWVVRDLGGRCLSSFISQQEAETWNIDNPAQPAGYRELTIEGWRVLVSFALERDSQLSARCLQVLAESLATISKRVPPKALARIKTVPIWLEYEDARFQGGAYHPSRQWLIENHMNPLKERSVQFTKNIATWIKDQPMMVLHELAHAYHDQVLSYQEPRIIEAYERARKSGKYDNVLRNNGHRERAYAMTDNHEFFAELSEAYFGTNDFFPFTRDDLKAFDPGSLAVVERAWNRQ